MDEFMAFVPGSPGTDGKLVLSSPQVAYTLLDTVPEWEPLFYGQASDQVIHGEATGGTASTLIDNTAGVDFTAGPTWHYARIYDGPGQGQVAEINSNLTTPNSITVTNVWRFTDHQDLYNVMRIAGGSDDSNHKRVGTWFPGAVPQGGSKYVLVPSTKMWLDRTNKEFPALITASEVRVDQILLGWNLTNAESRIAEESDTLVAALSGANIQVSLVPAIYLGNASPGSETAFAYVPGLVNFQTWNGEVWAPRPFGPRLNGQDLFAFEFEDELEPENAVSFLDNWNTYHRRYGEVHCGTNVFRLASGDYLNWWTLNP